MQGIIRIGLLTCALAAGLLGCSSSTQPTTDTSPASTPAGSAPVRKAHDPTVPREPIQSKSLTLASDWQPPNPTRTPPAQLKARVVATKQHGFVAPPLSQRPSDAEIGAVTTFPEPLRPLPGASPEAETEALAAALREKPAGPRGTDAIERFTDAYPQSRWAPGIHLNLGTISYHRGYFQDALAHWKAAWELAKTGEDTPSQQIANQALAEYARMNAKLGRTTELEALLKEAQSRTFMGDARVKIEGAAEGLWTMQHRPEISFMCGPYAVSNVAQVLHRDWAKKATDFVDKIKSPPTGFSIPEVHRMATELGLKLQIASREVGASVIVPAVVHWKLGHFGALVSERDGIFRLQDPTFRGDVWLSKQALDQEASGYFLVPAGTLPDGWTRVNAPEVAQIFGKGFTDSFDDGNTGDDDHQSGGDCGAGTGAGAGGGDGTGLQMATYRIHTLLANVHIEDTPVGYAAAVGPDVRVRVAYNQREANQPATMDFTNFGPQFVSNWVSYIWEQTPARYISIFLVKRGGGSETYLGDSSAGPTFRNSRGGIYFDGDVYRRVYPDGRQEYYEHRIGLEQVFRRVFLTRVVDPQGNQVTLEYDSTYPTRIHQIVDATGLPTVFHYDYPSNPYLVTSIEDPFGREGTFAYTSAAGQLRLQSIEDPYGIVSSFTYNTAGEIVKMATPYGTTTFNSSEPFVNTGESLIRYVEATDALGQKERVEFNISSLLTGVGASLEAPLPSSSVVNYTNDYNQYRNSYYWDKLQMKLSPGNYQKAHRYHWVHSAAKSVTGILESEVPPLEGRIFYNYPGQTQTNFVGTLVSPSVVARVVKDAQGSNQTQATKYEYNAQGNVTRVTDPVGRDTLYEYTSNDVTFPNGIDVAAIKQRTGTSGTNPVWTTVASYVYGSGAARRPSSVTDGAGKTTQYTYSPTTGQVLTITNAKNEVMTFTYETNTSSAAYRRLISITGDVPGGNRSFTYDTYGRVATSTDSEGYTLTYGYDSLDRIRTVTYPDGSYTQNEYQDHSLVASRDREGRWTRHLYNPLMQRVATQDPQLRTAQFQWCRCGKLRRFVDGNGNITEWQRDESTRVTKKVNPDASFEAYTYDLSGRLQTEVDAMGRTITYAYTVDDRIAKKDYSDAATPDVTYAYDPWYPRLTSQVDGTGMTTFTYHPDAAATLGAGQVALVNGPLSNDTLKHTYDELGRLKKLEIVDDATQTTPSYSEEFTFDTRGRVTGVQNNLGNATHTYVGQSNRPFTITHANGMLTTYDYFGATGDYLLKQIRNASAGTTPTTISRFDYTYRQDRAIDTWRVDQRNGVSTWTFGYDAARQLTSATRRDTTQAVLDSLSYDYDKAANRIQVGTATGAPRNYDVNNLNQLLSERDYGPTTFAGFVNEPAKVTVNGNPAKVTSTNGAAPFKFEAQVDLAVGANTVVVQARDGNDNVATKTYSVPTTGTSKKFEYDGNGNLRYEKQPNGTVIREYRWDQQNRLVRMLSGTHESVYDYDGQSRRVRITEMENSVQTKQENFIWCGSHICQKRSGSTILRSYFANGFEENTTTDYFYTHDHLGSVRDVVASNGTTVASRLSYDPWGKLTETGTVQSDFTYTGHYYDRQSGLSLAWYRGYDPNLGRWLSRDPIGLRGGWNLYGYVGNKPGNNSDPSGLLVGVDDAAEAGAAVIAGAVVAAGAAGYGLLCIIDPKACERVGDAVRRICEDLTPRDAAPRRPKPNLNRCLDACAMEGQGRYEFCRSIPDLSTRELCWAVAEASEEACRGFCYNNYGN